MGLVVVAQGFELRRAAAGRFEPSAVTGISTVRKDAGSALYYNVNGVRMSTPARGINIVRMPDGTVRKVLK